MLVYFWRQWRSVDQSISVFLASVAKVSGDSGTRATRAEPELQNDDRGDSGTRATRAEPKLRNDGRLVII